MNIKTTLALALILAAAAGLILWLEAGKTAKEPESPPEVWSVKEDSIRRVRISLPGQGKSAAFVLDSGGRWRFDDPGRSPVDPKRWGGIVLLVSGPRSKRLIAVRVESPAEFGLDAPRMVIELGVRGRKAPLTVLVGDRTPDRENYYVSLKGQGPVYLVNKTWGLVLERLVTEPPLPAIIKEQRKELKQ